MRSLKRCEHCNSMVREDRYPKHLRNIHGVDQSLPNLNAQQPISEPRMILPKKQKTDKPKMVFADPDVVNPNKKGYPAYRKS